MINFFRKIRLRLLPENKPASPVSRLSKYLLYATGEIMLVVIGILIALQINTWNENRKLEALELKFLKSFRSSMKADNSYRLESDRQYEIARNSMDYLIDYMGKDLPYFDSLDYHFNMIVSDWGLVYDLSTYESLKSKDINLISNDSLRQNLVRYYTYAEGLSIEFTRRYTEVIEDASKNILKKHFDQMWSGRMDGMGTFAMKPNDYEGLKEDKEFRYFLKTLKNQNYWLITRPIKTSTDYFNEISPQLDQEIKRLSDN